MNVSEDTSQPPEVPEIDRGLQLYPWQWIGMPLLILVPVLALLGIFGDREGTVRAEDAVLEVRVEYPERLRAGRPATARVLVRNRAARPLESVRVSLDSSYLAGFADLRILPLPQRAYEVDLGMIGPGESRLVRMEMIGEAYGRHSGEVAARAGEGRGVRAHLRTFVFP